ncbi:MAG: 16S rRNA processing protein RimM [Clostridiales bacterium]|nr:16S rRNA processing protein RimM [Clostridiales bacterium]
MLKQYIEIGKITSTHGVCGEVRIEPWANSPEFLCGFKALYIDGVPVKVLSARVHKSAVIALLDGVTDVDGAVRLKNKIVFIDRKDAGLETGEYFIADLIGLSAVDDATGEELGRITDILPLNPNNIYVINGQREILVPAVSEFVREINTEAGYIRFRLIEGM